MISDIVVAAKVVEFGLKYFHTRLGSHFPFVIDLQPAAVLLCLISVVLCFRNRDQTVLPKVKKVQLFTCYKMPVVSTCTEIHFRQPCDCNEYILNG